MIRSCLTAKLLVTAAALLACTSAYALVANDNASNYGGSWTDASNGGTGFLAWLISGNNDGTSLFAGTFIGDSTAGAGDINTSGVSFGLYANPSDAFVNADRGFATSLVSGDAFSFQLGVNFDNGNKGFNLFAGTQGEVFNFNVGGGGSVSSANATLNPGSGAGYDYGGNDAVIDVSITMTSNTAFNYLITRTSSQGNQGTLFSGSVTNLTDNVTGFRFYNSGTDNGINQNNLYVNNLSVVPEPSSLAFILGCASLAATRRQRRNSSHMH